jgi:hypothetical protein
VAKALLPENHLLLASSKRVLALILEEIAIDTQQVFIFLQHGYKMIDSEY